MKPGIVIVKLIWNPSGENGGTLGGGEGDGGSGGGGEGGLAMLAGAVANDGGNGGLANGHGSPE